MRSDTCVLLFWIDEPSVVIGRNQNPWTECDIRGMNRDKVLFVRRKSGGGTVYHDSGNLNISLMTSRDTYTKHRLTRVIATALNRDFNLGVYVNDRNDLAINGKKVSGSAYKLGGRCAYHHCTLLTNTDVTSVGRYLHSDRDGIVESRGVSSVRSPVSALSDHMAGGSKLSINAVIESIKRELVSHVVEGGLEANEMDSFYPEAKFLQQNTVLEVPSEGKGRDTREHRQPLSDNLHTEEMINPETDKSVASWCRQYSETLVSWDWQYGQTPQFSQRVERTFPWGNVILALSCRRGVVESVVVNIVHTDGNEDSDKTNNDTNANYNTVTQEIQYVCIDTRYAVKDDLLAARATRRASNDATNLNGPERRCVSDILDWIETIYTI